MTVIERHGPHGRDLVMLDPARGPLSVGKSPDTDLVVDGDPAVSRLHAKLEPIGPGWCITDLDSTNGTMVNGERVFTPRRLRDGDEILLGRTRLVFRDPASRADDVATERLSRAPRLTPTEHTVLVELCRPLVSGHAFTPPASARAIAERLFVTEAAVKQHLGHLYDKFDIHPDEPDGTRRDGRVRLANEALQRGSITLRDLKDQPGGS